MGVLLIAVTISLMASNTNGIVFAEQGGGIVTISGLPNQTADASIQVPLKTANPDGPPVYTGGASINIPGIGSGQVSVELIANGNLLYYKVTISQLPGQTQSIESDINTQIGNPNSAPIDIPGIGKGTLTIQ